MNSTTTGSRRKRIVLVMLLLLLVFGAGFIWDNVLRREPLPVFPSVEDEFKYGALGYGIAGQDQGFPFYLWSVLPEVFADLLPGPGGWAAFGLVTEPGMDQPVGFAKVTVGFPGLVPNCALCHTGTYRTSPEGPSQLVMGAPAEQLDFDGFNAFVIACTHDPRWKPSVLLPAIDKKFKLSMSEKLFYRALILGIPKAMGYKHLTYSWKESRPRAGIGRTDAFNHTKFDVLGLPDDGTIGTADYLPLWDQRHREGLWLHWNGTGNKVRDENLLTVMSIINKHKDFNQSGFDRVSAYWWDLQPPRFPLSIDSAKAERGRLLYAQECASCHAFGEKMTGQVMPLEEVRTDPELLGMWTQAFVDKFRSEKTPPFVFPTTRMSNGYSNLPLDGIWLRAPYLHNGSVPTMWDLLQSPEKRPKSFERGGDLVDGEKLGFKPVPGGTRKLFLFDTSQRGNSNSGHVYGVDLSNEDKMAIIEFTKTL